MFGSLSRVVATTAIVVFASMTIPAQAQLYPGAACSTCNTPAPMMARPVLFPRLRARMSPCAVQSQCCQPCSAVAYQPQIETRQVAVTEYQQVKQTVKRPVAKTAYVDQKVTEYKQVMEQKTVDVPTVSYQNVTEYHTQTRDMGKWQTYRQCVNKVSPCQYDGRPNLLGMMSRTGYSIRNSFTPSYVTRRQYVPQYVSHQVPVTRQVAIRGTQKKTYSVARIVPVETTRKVAVLKTEWVDEEITTSRPVTVMKTIQGTRTAYGFVPLSDQGTRTATKPTPEPTLNRSATKPKEFKTDNETSFNTNKPVIKTPQPVKPAFKTTPQLTRAKTDNVEVTSESNTRSLPSIVRVGGWRARSPQASQPRNSIKRPTSVVARNVEVANSLR